MVTNRCPNRRIRATQPQGFALIVTLTMMILLTVIAVGLLSLASVSLRNSGQTNAVSMARANARMALMIAIGELQKSAGPDQRITARADILDEDIANPKLTGVWDSREITLNTQPSDFEKQARDEKFRGWLVSGDPKESNKLDFASQATPEADGSASKSAPGVKLWGTGSVGKNTAAQNAASNEVTVNKIPITSSPGALAWAVMDEGVKVRVNTTYADEIAGVTAKEAVKTARLGTGRSPGLEFIDELKDMDRKFFEKSAPQALTLGKGITRLNFALAGEKLAASVTPEKLLPLAHDITTVSTGLFTDVARGGLKQDFQLATNSTTMPSEYSGTVQGKSIYGSRGILPSGTKSDPQWESLRQFATIYKDASLSKPNNVPTLKAKVPPSWYSSTGTLGATGGAISINAAPPAGAVLTPTIAKVQMLFSLIGRDIYPALPANITRRLTTSEKAASMHGPQDGVFRNTKYDYDLHLLYTPIVTLYNPYNVAIETSTMRLDFIGVPFAMQVFRNGQPLSKGLVPFDTMFENNKEGSNSKVFSMNLKTKANGKVGSPVFKLLPGESMTFSPYIDPTLTYAQDLKASEGDRAFWDITVGTKITNKIDAIPGWRGFGIGFDCDWLAGNQPSISGDDATTSQPPYGLWKSCYGLAYDDQIHVEFAPFSTPTNQSKFVIQLSATIGSTPERKISTIEMKYDVQKGLQKFLLGSDTATLRYPKSDATKKFQLGNEMREPATTAIGGLQKVKPFALLTVQAKNTSGGIDSTNVDGRFSGKPWAFAHSSIGASSINVVKEHSANHSHEIDLRLLPETEVAVFPSIEPTTDRASFITGNTSDKGTKFGVLYDVPLAPVQTLASLNGANPGGSSGYLPRFAQPIGNSWAHPLLSTDKIYESGPSGYNYLDHSFLLNVALYDGFYFSGFADQTGAFGNGRTARTIAGEIAEGRTLDDPRIHVRPPAGKIASDLESVVTSNTGYKEIAAWETMDGAFNINSTSVPAWKAMLASIHDAEALVNLRAGSAGTSTKLTDLTASKPGEARISRFRLPASNSAENGATPTDGFWLGPREYSNDEIQQLAENIVKQVRLRGPFLSMAEFVNRRLGPAGDDMSQRGALQQAIDDTKVGGKFLNEKLLGGGSVKAGYEIPASAITKYGYKNPKAGEGPSYQGAPGYLTQADILNVLGNAATVRSDTFTVRAYGEARNEAGMVLATATCEAVVQRIPEWLDKADTAETPVAALVSNENKNFGRRFTLTSFRWLNGNEI